MAKNKRISKAQRRKIAIAQEAIKARDQMEQMMLNNEIYIISVDEQGTPFLVNNQYLLLYFKKESADEAAQGFCKLYGDGKIHTFKIEDNMRFFEMMWYYGMPEFILNGDSNIYNIGAFFKLSKKPTNASKGLEIKNKQHVRNGKLSLHKNIKIKEWFSVFSTISLVCGLAFWIAFLLFKEFIKPGITLGTLAIISIVGVLSGIIAVNGAHKQFIKSEPKTVVGIILSILALISCFGMI